MGDDRDEIDKVASSWTLRGWSPPWTRATVTLRGLKSPSTWMYDSTTYRNHTKNVRVSNCVRVLQNPSLYILASCMLYFPLPIYSWHACLICIVNVEIVPKLHLNSKNLKNCNFATKCLITPPLDTSSRSLSIGIRALVSIALV